MHLQQAAPQLRSAMIGAEELAFEVPGHGQAGARFCAEVPSGTAKFGTFQDVARQWEGTRVLEWRRTAGGREVSHAAGTQCGVLFVFTVCCCGGVGLPLLALHVHSRSFLPRLFGRLVTAQRG